MLKFNEKKCVCETEGVIIKKRWDGDVWFITVQYSVHGINYTRTEQVKYEKVSTYKLGALPVGIHSKIVLESIEIGTRIRVLYDPDKPKRSFFPDNKGIPLM